MLLNEMEALENEYSEHIIKLTFENKLSTISAIKEHFKFHDTYRLLDFSWVSVLHTDFFCNSLLIRC